MSVDRWWNVYCQGMPKYWQTHLTQCHFFLPKIHCMFPWDLIRVSAITYLTGCCL